MSGQPSLRIGYVGLGVMGLAMARNLLKAGFAVTVHNRSPAKVEEAVRDGAVAGGSPAGVAAASDVVFLCLPDTPDVETVLFGPEGIATGGKPGLIVVDTSTISPTATVAFAERLGSQGIELVDSPVSGGPAGAIAGTLSCMIGGSAAAVERAQPAFQAVGKTFVHLGASGAGQLTKACNQLVIGATLAGVSEAIALCRKAGVDPALMRQALLGGSAQSRVLEGHGQRIIDGSFPPGFRAELMLKDLRIAQATGRDHGAFLPATALVAELFGALCTSPRRSQDVAVFGDFIQTLSGIGTET